ncbi:heme biosynthesis HemY N-terminal domain-containing protein [Crenobacter intestini]|uniref:Heme biosynthesis protein HemY n=1 Tax=Crenobacter intestini TaxID=2563443 RepID=A0A4T0V2Z6_9NEIS|nr:heme biosynthesis HemY N-terminal domain-containing protein [Crenobacter intestini]TIC86000.1 heme biosynthesis protein HemY [Crenobacter intestini]
MKFVLWIVGLFALAVLLGLAATVNNGYAILFFPPYRLEVSFNLMIISVFVLIAVAHALLRLLSLAVRLPEEVRQFQRQKKLKASRHALREAALSFFEGRYQKAEREAARAMEDEFAVENRALALLISARSAAQTQDKARRDACLERLGELPERLQLARHMLEAELRYEDRDTLAALSAVERARALSPNLTSALRLELKIRLQLGQPEAVLQLTEKLLKADALDASQARRYRVAAYRQQLAALVDGESLLRWWGKVPQVERGNDELLLEVAERLSALGEADRAASLLAERIPDSEDTALVQALARFAPALSDERRKGLLRDAEAWLRDRPRDAALLFALGSLAQTQQLWGKAQSYYEASLSVAPSLQATAALAALLESLDKPEAAERYRQQALQMALAAES